MSSRARAFFAPAVLSAAAVVTTIAGCGSGGSGDITPGGSTSGNGSVNIAITDAPVDFASNVFVDFTGIELTPQTGNRITVSITPTRTVDLLTLQGGVSLTLLQNQAVPAGNYTRVRFILNAQSNSSYVDLVSGQRYPLVIPTGSEAGLTLDRNFTVAKDGRMDLMADFDLRKSLTSAVSTTGNYVFKPVLRLVDSAQVGTISGTVGPNLVSGICEPYVYVFSGSNVVPDDIDLASDIDPLVSVPVKLNNSSGTYTYRASFLEAGNYTVSFACLNGAQDDPETEDLLGFSRTLQATVVVGQTAVVDFGS
jgi:hypothetical protein